MFLRKTITFFLFFHSLFGAEIPEKVLICGIGKDVETAVANTIFSAETLGGHFEDYRVIIYENNSRDFTKELFSSWASNNNKVIFISENVSTDQLKQDSKMNVVNRTEVLARARNIVLARAMSAQFDEYKYIIWADLDFLEPWDIPHLVETILHPEQDWDGVFAYGAYDLFALRSEKWPIGFELLGNLYWSHLDDIWETFIFEKASSWEPVYSAFGGIALYKRESMRGCRYSGTVTLDLETLTKNWLKKARQSKNVCLLKDYEELLKKNETIELKKLFLNPREKYPKKIGVKLFNGLGEGKVTWFSCTEGMTLPWTCEHIPFHASMILKGKNKLFINPKLRSNHP